MRQVKLMLFLNFTIENWFVSISIMKPVSKLFHSFSFVVKRGNCIVPMKAKVSLPTVTFLSLKQTFRIHFLFAHTMGHEHHSTKSGSTYHFWTSADMTSDNTRFHLPTGYNLANYCSKIQYDVGTIFELLTHIQLSKRI